MCVRTGPEVNNNNNNNVLIIHLKPDVRLFPNSPVYAHPEGVCAACRRHNIDAPGEFLQS